MLKIRAHRDRKNFSLRPKVYGLKPSMRRVPHKECPNDDAQGPINISNSVAGIKEQSAPQCADFRARISDFFDHHTPLPTVYCRP
jgi:hypothetical protein